MNDHEARDLAESAGRIGLVARGFLYVVAGLLAIRVVTGDPEEVNKEGALGAIGRQPFGRVLLVLLVCGFAAYAVWRLTKAVTGAREGGEGGALSRLADGGRALLYVALTFTALRFVVDPTTKSSASGADEEKEWTAELLSRSYGRALVGLVGAAVLGGGLYLVVKGIRAKFEDKLRLQDMTPRERQLLPVLGRVGYTARGLVFGLIGWFVLKAAIEFDPNESVGVDDALKRLLEASHGPALVLAVAVGLLSFGLFSFVEARWRKVLES